MNGINEELFDARSTVDLFCDSTHSATFELRECEKKLVLLCAVAAIRFCEIAISQLLGDWKNECAVDTAGHYIEIFLLLQYMSQLSVPCKTTVRVPASPS